MAKKSTAKKIDDVIAARRQEIESTLAEMIEIIDKYSLVAPFSS